MQHHQFYVLVLAFLALATQPSFGMMSPNHTQKDQDRDRDAILHSNVQEIYSQDVAIDVAAQNLCAIALQKTKTGRTYFNPPHYEQHLNCHPTIPWQALFVANYKMIKVLTSQLQIRNGALDTPCEYFKHKQCATIYCETARELLKRVKEGNPAKASIKGLKNLSESEYRKAYKSQTENLNEALHIARHRWNECACTDIYWTASLCRK